MSIVTAPMPALSENLLRSALRHPNRAALRSDTTVLTYAELEERTARVAAFLRDRGIAAGDRVALMLPNVPEFVVLYYGILRAGAVVVPMNPLLKSREVAYYLRDSAAALLLDWIDGPGEGPHGALAAETRCSRSTPTCCRNCLPHTNLPARTARSPPTNRP